jgi:hypothetical protein
VTREDIDMSNTLLSDDEVVALAVTEATGWPVPLTTVPTTPSELGAAVLRGRRSLAIRELVGSDGSTSAEVSEPVKSAVSALVRWYAYTAARDSLSVPSGSSTYAFLQGESATIDTVSAAGVHRFATGTAEEASDLIVALAKNVFDHGFRGAEGEGALVVGSTGASSWILVGKDRMESGTFSDDGFTPSSAVQEWDPAAFLAVLRS